jgi:DNA invertase Pin-like site-specific DNA recombinase
MEIIGYGRVSTEEQSDDEGALVKQLRRLRESGATRIFYDIGKRTNDKREGINQAIAYIESRPPGAIAKLLFLRLDRLSASPVLFYQLLEVCRRQKVLLEALDDNFDVETVGGEFSADIRVALAKHEVKMISLRVRKDLETREKAGKPPFFPPFGYKIAGETYDRYEKDDTPLVCLLDGKRELSVAEVARMRVDAFFETGTCRAAVKRLNEIFGITRNTLVTSNDKASYVVTGEEEISNELWEQSKKTKRIFSNRLGITSTGIQNWLTNPVLAGGTPRGVTYPGKKNYKPRRLAGVQWDTHPNEAIMTIQERDRILEMFSINARNRWVADTPKASNVFSGLIRCANCGSSCSIQGSRFVKRENRLQSWFQCNFYRSEKLCHNKTMITDTKIEKQLIPYLVAEAERLSAIAREELPMEEPQAVIEMRRQMHQLELIPNPNSAILRAIEDLQSQIIDTKAGETNRWKETLISQERVVNSFSDSAFWESIKLPADKKRLISQIVREIRVFEGALVEVILR